jgi:hypothetical protein
MLNCWKRVNNELEGMWKEVVMVYNLRHNPTICLERLNETTGACQESWCPSQYLKQTPPEYKGVSLLLEPTWFVNDELYIQFGQKMSRRKTT